MIKVLFTVVVVIHLIIGVIELFSGGDATANFATVMAASALIGMVDLYDYQRTDRDSRNERSQ